MFKLALAACVVVVLTGAAAAESPEFRCIGERIERKGSTWGYARAAGSDLRVETTSESVGWARQAGSDWRIETFAGSTLGFLRGARIEKGNGETWTTLETARRLADCADPVAAALWVLRQAGKL